MTEEMEKDRTISAKQGEVRKEEFSIVTEADYLRVDNLCRGVLLDFYHHLQDTGMSPEDATVLANGADYYLRDFLLDRMGANVFEERAGVVRKFAGNWYIVSNVEPDMNVLGAHLAGVRAFYRYLGERGLVSQGHVEAMEAECDLLEYYRQRIESFWLIEGGGFEQWEGECSIKENQAVTGHA